MTGALGMAGLTGMARAATPDVQPPHSPPPWPGGAPAAVSLTYDDGLTSHLDYAAPALDARGWKGDFFLTLANMEDRMADWKKVAARGHAIGNHTVNHRCDLRPYAPTAFIQDEVVAAQTVLDREFPGQPHLYAYPCGVTDLGRGGPNQQLHRYKRLLQASGFLAARVADGDPVTAHLAWERRFALPADAVTYENDDTEEGLNYLDLAMAHGGWAILIFHGLAPKRQESGDTSLAVHEALLDAIAARKMWVASMGEVLEHIRPKAD